MHTFPHNYQVSATANATGDVILSGKGLPDIASQPPIEFDGPGDKWSPESLLMAAIADCFTLSFRAIATASRVSFNQLNVSVDGALDKAERKMLFTEVEITAKLSVSKDTDIAKVERLLHLAEQSCLVTNSLNVDCTLIADVSIS